MAKLILLSILWFGAISVFAYSLFRYLDNRHERKHEETMAEKAHNHEERQALFDED